jgi:hypothetical protein
MLKTITKGVGMKKALFIVSLLLLQVGFLAYTVSAGDCSGNYTVLRNYQPGHGGPCKMLGLDSHQGVCQAGYAYETLCDDTSGGRYKTCQGPRACNSNSVTQPSQPAQPAQPQPNCTSWDYSANRPCPTGYINRDCSGGCGKI